MNRCFDEDDIRLRLLKHISASSSHLTQRDFAGSLGGAQPGKDALLPDRADKKRICQGHPLQEFPQQGSLCLCVDPTGNRRKTAPADAVSAAQKNEYQLLEQEIAQLTQELGSHKTNEPIDRS